MELKEENSEKIKDILKTDLSKIFQLKRQKIPNSFGIPLKIYMSLFVISSLLEFMNSQGDAVSQPSYITLRLNKTGEKW